MLSLAEYCSPTGWSPVWAHHGFSPCFLDTLAAAVIGGVVLFALILFVCQRKQLSRRKVVDGKAVRVAHWLEFALFSVVFFSRALVLFYAVGTRGSTPLGKSVVASQTTLALSFLASLALLQALRPRANNGVRGVVRAAPFLALLHAALHLASYQSPWEPWNGDDNTAGRVATAAFALYFAASLLACAAAVFSYRRYAGAKLYRRPRGRRNGRINDGGGGGGGSGDVEAGEADSDDDSHGDGGSDATDDGLGDLESGSAFKGFWRKTKVLLPYIWHKESPLLQAYVLVAVGCLVAGRVINVYVPIYNKNVVDELTATTVNFHAVYPVVLTYVGLKFLQGGGTGGTGLVNNLRQLVWVRVQQNTERKIRVKLFSHLHSLSLNYHLKRKTGEVLRVMDRGTSSINGLLSSVVFSILPTLIDIVIAIVYFVAKFDIYFGIIVFTTMVSYIAITIVITEWRTKFRRAMNEMDNQTRQKAVDSLINFESVKYYTGERFEVERHNESILNYQQKEWVSQASLNLLNSAQNVIITFGLLAGTMLCAWRVAHGELNVGDFVLYLAYISQLLVPLNWFGTYYRTIQQNFIDMENMLSLMNVKQDVVDAPDATELAVSGGEIRFDHVTFYYDAARPILRDVSFTIPAGENWAVVGASGGGKSTMVRLILRFYDLQGGRILIDGQDIAGVTQESLRRSIGVVPQDTALFMDTVRYNVRYGRIADPERVPTDEEVEEAARAADIHEQVLSFPNQYDTVVGERGLRLSGGEKQRVAIARTVLKSPRIALLDEATSALDTETERNIQRSLGMVCADRTSLTVAHRLSTIIGSHRILVLKDGVIAESGPHAELLRTNGLYAEMWQRQLEANQEGHMDLAADGSGAAAAT